MPSAKKSAPRLRARREDDSDEEPHSSELDVSSPSILDTGEDGGGDIQSSDVSDDNDASELEEEEPSEDPDEGVQDRLSKVSFGALATAHQELEKEGLVSRKRKRNEDSAEQQDDKLRVLRQRLEELRSKKKVTGADKSTKAKHPKTQAKATIEADDSNASSDSSDEEGAPKGRSSKHAPAVQTSTKPVSRKRTIFESNKPKARDPRFDPLIARPEANKDTTSKKYSFLKDYRATELSEMKSTLAKTKNPELKETLKRQIHSIESRNKAQAAKDKQQEVIREHRKKEKEAVAQGKKPFYMKESEIKKQALVEKFNSMKGKDREKAIQRRRKKIAGKEKKNMPQARRFA